MTLIKLFSVFLVLSLSLSASGQIEDDFTLPETWTRDFTIVLSYHGSMSGGKTALKFTFDSCTYLNQQTHAKKPKLKTYKMKEADRAAILKKLAELKADQIKSESSVHAVNDGWSQSICFGFHCIEGGTSAEMSETDKNLFLTAYRYLEELAIKKTR
jgi:hypothetical protein